MNCIIVDDDFVSREILKELVQLKKDMNLIGVCKSAAEAMQLIDSEAIDLIYLDIDMPEMSGIDMARSLKNAPLIILVTGNDDFALEAFELQAVDYLLKPVDKIRFLQATDRAYSIFERTQGVAASSEFLFVKQGARLVKVVYWEIHYIEAQADYIHMVTADKKFLVHSTMRNMEKKLPRNNFMRIHRSFIINLHHLDEIEDTTAILGKHMVPIGNTYKQRLFRAINAL